MQAAPSSPTTAAAAAPAESTAPIASTPPNTSTAPATGSTSAAPGTESTSGATPSSTGSLSNNDVKDLIQRSLRNEPSLSSSNVNVVVTESEVQLSGTVPTEADKATIRDIAQQNAGSRKVNASDLTVK
jgi:osmotically-inducible protein OsmY